MSLDALRQFSINSISSILPLDGETCSQMVDHVLTLGTDSEIQNYFLQLLGESDDSLSFIHKFLEWKHEITKKSQSSQKKKFNDTHHENETKSKKQSQPAWGSGASASTAQGVDNKGRLSGKTKSTTTSQLLDGKVKPSSKKSKKKNLDNLKDIDALLTELEINSDDHSGRRVCNCMATRHPLFEVAPNCLNCGKIICAKEGLQPCSYCGNELLSASEKLEIMQILNTEKVSLEEKQPDLKKKIAESSAIAAKQKAKAKKITITMKAGENLWHAQDRALKEADKAKKEAAELLAAQKKELAEIEEQAKELKKYERAQNVTPELLAAQEKLETLLNFQATGAERTRIIDNAADFDTSAASSGISSGSMWLSPIERALQLRKQQRQLRKNKTTEMNRTGRGKKIVEMVIRNGKVEMVERNAIPGEVTPSLPNSENEDASDFEDQAEIRELEQKIKDKKSIEDSSISKNVWDYEKDSETWEKPVYIGSGVENGEGREALGQQLPNKPRVQFFNDSETNELLV
ncbi:RQC trigger complex subunit Rqt4p [[Candida] railenensis]|uniref:RQC trigger complex subunit Rqt4p n=1 Tax=[Candida] railenensis TaxID=45579 RepID=A0A9P0VWX3_9ASCO|nr:RQC trigger complex subunit Rqt4p [[Candida] railenensis]